MSPYNDTEDKHSFYTKVYARLPAKKAPTHGNIYMCDRRRIACRIARNVCLSTTPAVYQVPSSGNYLLIFIMLTRLGLDYSISTKTMRHTYNMCVFSEPIDVGAHQPERYAYVDLCACRTAFWHFVVGMLDETQQHASLGCFLLPMP